MECLLPLRMYSFQATVAAASFVWKFVQAFFTQFPKYENHDFCVSQNDTAVIMTQVGHYQIR
jgi:hypothetical protein